jgi:hypothetical protein
MHAKYARTNSTMHILISSTQVFDSSLMQTVIHDNIKYAHDFLFLFVHCASDATKKRHSPIERAEATSMVVAGHDIVAIVVRLYKREKEREAEKRLINLTTRRTQRRCMASKRLTRRATTCVVGLSWFSFRV